MKVIKSLLAGMAGLSIAMTGLARESETEDRFSGQGSGMLKLGGQVRFEFNRSTDKINGSRTNFVRFVRPQFNLNASYENDNTWAFAKLRWREIGGTTADFYSSGVTLRDARIGSTLVQEGDYRLNLELGRWGYMHQVFDSSVQFDDRLDGIVLSYNNKLESFSDFEAILAAFQIESDTDSWGFCLQLSLEDISDTGLYTRYSYKDNKDYRTSQFTAGYKFMPEKLKKDTKFYGAYIHNHAAQAVNGAEIGPDTYYSKKEADAFYLGVDYGTIKAAGDWMINAEYQYVEENATPADDNSGIHKNIDGAPNYKGWKLSFTNSVTDDLKVVATASYAKEAEKRAALFAPTYSHKFFELETIYSF